MGVDIHNQRNRVVVPTQHLLTHAADEIGFLHEALPPTVTHLGAAMNWILAVLYPRHQDSVANVAALPAVGNTLLDYRVVEDDGDGRAAGYRWEQREGDVAAKWYKIYDMDWTTDSVLAGFLAKTQDVYVYRYGYDDRDDTGTAYTGVLGGQHIYGGASANTHLTLFANSGDGTGADTGYVQMGDNVRPLTDSVFSLGTNAERWLKVWTDEITIGTLTVTGGSIVDSSGTINFDNENLTTTGTITGGGFAAASGTFGTLTVAGGSITDTTGAISFANENLTTTGTFAAASAALGTLALAGGSITDSSGSISFGDENLATTGSLGAGAITGTQLDIDNVRIDANTISATNANGNVVINANGVGVIDVNSPMETLGQTIVGNVGMTGDGAVTGQWQVDSLLLNGSTISSTAGNADIELDPHGTGKVTSYALMRPDADNAYTLGETARRWTSLFLSTSIGDGTNAITMATLLSFRDALTGVAAGMTLFWDDGDSKWVASLPDTEVDHGTITGLGDDDHTQYALLAGRAGGQTLQGGTLASQALTLESTAHATKGEVIWIGALVPSADNTYDVGKAAAEIKDLYQEGQWVGGRLQNAATADRPAAGRKGRLVYDTDLDDVFVDRGGAWAKLSIEKYVLQDTTGWDGVATSVVYTVSSEVSDARECIWVLKDNSNNFRQMAVAITMTQTQVTVTVDVPLPAGTYTLVGVG